MRTILGVRSCDSGIQGPENLILALAEQLAQRGVRYTVANLWDGVPPVVELHEEMLRRGHGSHVLATSWGMSPAIVSKLARLIGQVQPEIVHTHDVKAEFAAVGASLLRKATATRRRNGRGNLAQQIPHFQLIGSYYGRLALHSKFLRFADLSRFALFRSFHRVLANSTAQQAELRRFRVPATRIDILPSFVDSTVLRPPDPEEYERAREKLGISPSQFVLTTVARLSRNKGHTYMLQALPAIRAAVPEVLYLVPGEGDAPWRGEGGLRGELEAETERLGLAGHVRFLGYHPDLRTLYHATDVVVSPSLLEGMQVALLEAMSAGRPIVATAIGGTPDAIVDGETGLLVPPADPHALAQAVIRLFHDPSLRRRLGASGRQRLESQFDVRVVAEKFLSICERDLQQTS
ncbi:MAG TPA: glycosyltransferase family 4 protein [Pirellulaceae bacterium]